MNNKSLSLCKPVSNRDLVLSAVAVHKGSYLNVYIIFIIFLHPTQSCTHAGTRSHILAPHAHSLHIQEKVKANGKASAEECNSTLRSWGDKQSQSV